MLQVWIIKSIESTNICCTSVRVVCAIEETLIECDGLLQTFMR